MFELIRANKVRSMILLVIMFVLLLAVGFGIGLSVYPIFQRSDLFLGEAHYVLYLPWGGLIGMGIAFLVWGVQSLAAFFEGDRLLMASAGASQVQRQDHPQLFNVVEEMTIAAQLPCPPKIYVIQDMGLNAFAAGRDAKHASVAVTAGLLGTLDRNQLQGVVAHEVAHIANRDVLFMTMAGIMAGTIVMLSETFMRATWYGSQTRRYRSSRRGGNDGSGLLIMVIAMLLAIIAPLIANLLYLACSRRREYLADAGAAVFTRYPEGLASALEVIANGPAMPAAANRITAPMFIANPLDSDARFFSSWTSTHPPIEERIQILRTMAGGVSYRTYAKAWEQNKGRSTVRMPASAMAGPEVPMAVPRANQDTAVKAQQMAGALAAGVMAAASRSAPVQANPAMAAATMAATAGGLGMAAMGAPEVRGLAGTDGIPVARARQRSEAGDIIRRMNQFQFIPCDCGLTLKLPPNFSRAEVACPRCHKVHAVPGGGGA